MKPPPPAGFKARPFDNRLDAWLTDTAIIANNGLEQVTREFFSVLKSEHTRKAYFRALQRFFGAMLHPELDALGKFTTEHIQVHVNLIGCPIPADTSKDPHINTRALALAALRKYFGYLKKKGHIARDPAEDAALSIPAKVEGKTKALTAAELKTLLASIEPASPLDRRDRALIAFLAYTGCRIGAALKLTHGGLREDGVIVLSEKGNRPHRLPMPPPLAAYLAPYFADLVYPESTEPVFRIWSAEHARFLPEPVPYLEAYHVIVRRGQAAGIEQRVTPHCFRATAITGLIKAGVRLEKVRQFANHKRYDTTLLYNRDAEFKSRDMDYLVKAYEEG